MINRCCLDKPTKSITCLWGPPYIISPQSEQAGHRCPSRLRELCMLPHYKLG